MRWGSLFILGPQSTHHQARRPAVGSGKLAGLSLIRKEENMEKAVKVQGKEVKVISVRCTCAPNGEQVGLSHYLMADAKKAK